ncbi:MAG: methylated-DNA--[protein]-cysteine S-methyltransferase [Gemmatimonadota bacterium]|nr:methylated-DNA--[protein]-cysteine S-methyltransferase [Gemmatimonadota bacterium]
MGSKGIQRRYFSKTIDSPVGPLILVASERGLAAVQWPTANPRCAPLDNVVEAAGNPVLEEAARQLTQYFAGERTHFSIELDFGGTDFQRQVWEALLTIPFGETRSYGQIAKQIGRPTAVRAVGAANGQNPLPIIAPCHRVIGSTGKLTGFGGGLPMKEQLLTHEGALGAVLL